MGTVPMLLMVIAATGITYGWQPEKNRTDGSMEYIVQVSPSELAEIQAIGEISSVIDPRVRGHISRVVIRIGDGPLPRSEPPMIAQNQHRQSTRHMQPTRPGNLQDSSDAVVVMKPEPQGGFGMPDSLSNSFEGAQQNIAEGVRSGVDQAGRTIGNEAKTAINNLLNNNPTRPPTQPANDNTVVPPPSTRAPNFTGSNPNDPSSYARARPGGPSTDPNAGRNNDWNRLATSGQDRPSTTPPPNQSPFAANPTNANARSAADSRSATIPPNMNARTTTTSGRGATGLQPGDLFGQLPAGLQPTAQSGANALRDQNPWATNTPSNTSDNSFSGNNTASNNNSPMSQAEQMRRDAEQRDLLRRQQQWAAQNAAANPNAQPPNYNRQNPTTNYSADNAAANPPQFQPRSSRNPRLTQAQVAAGAWDLDFYGRPVGYDGKLVDMSPSNATANPNAPSTYPGNDPRGTYAGGLNPPANPGLNNQAPTANYPGPTANYNNGATRYNNPNLASAQAPARGTEIDTRFPVRGAAGSYPNSDYSNIPRRTPAYADETDYVAAADLRYGEQARRETTLARQSTATSRGESDTVSLSDRDRAKATSPIAVSAKPREVAAQPLFNGLLIISVVANIYLIFWLKNLRVQFKDLVTTRRVSGAGSSAAA